PDLCGRIGAGSILIISVGLRVSAAASLGNGIEALPGNFDEISYHALATRLLGGYRFTFARVWWPYSVEPGLCRAFVGSSQRTPCLLSVDLTIPFAGPTIRTC